MNIISRRNLIKMLLGAAAFVALPVRWTVKKVRGSVSRKEASFYKKITIIAWACLLPMALASCSTMDHIDAAIDKHHLRKYFKHLVSAAHTMPGKPHPEIYLKTAELLGIDPTLCLAIEDSFFGLVAAKAARMKVLSMPDRSEYDQPRFGAADLKIRSLREINEETFEYLQKL